MSIFEGYIYPANDEIMYLDYFKDYFDSVFVCFNPFFKMPAEYISLDYPSELETVKLGEIVTWKEVKEGCKFNNFSELALALRTSIGALLNSNFKDENLENILEIYCEKNEIFEPGEGSFGNLTERDIKKVFEINGYEKVIIQDEFGDRNSAVFVNSLEEELYHDYNNITIKNIYTPDKKILFTIDWDSHYFLFCSSREIIEKSLKETKLEGFFSDEKTCHCWEVFSENKY